MSSYETSGIVIVKGSIELVFCRDDEDVDYVKGFSPGYDVQICTGISVQDDYVVIRDSQGNHIINNPDYTYEVYKEVETKKSKGKKNG